MDLRIYRFKNLYTNVAGGYYYICAESKAEAIKLIEVSGVKQNREVVGDYKVAFAYANVQEFKLEKGLIPLGQVFIDPTILVNDESNSSEDLILDHSDFSLVTKTDKMLDPLAKCSSHCGRRFKDNINFYVTVRTLKCGNNSTRGIFYCEECVVRDYESRGVQVKFKTKEK